jgi:hypothetical protein
VSRRAAPVKQIGALVGEALVVTARRAADAAAASVVDDVRAVAVQALARLRAILPPGFLPPQQSQQPAPQPPPQRVHFDVHVVK